jgi:hypothetical protein
VAVAAARPGQQKFKKNCPAVKMLLAAKIEFWEVIKIDKIRSSYLKIRLKLILD